jgi:hypothetical protein
LAASRAAKQIGRTNGGDRDVEIGAIADGVHDGANLFLDVVLVMDGLAQVPGRLASIADDDGAARAATLELELPTQLYREEEWQGNSDVISDILRLSCTVN